MPGKKTVSALYCTTPGVTPCSVTIATIHQWARQAPADPQTVAAAQALLATLPLERVPDVDALPAGSRMPSSANLLFVGREPELQQIGAALVGQATVAIGQPAAVTGLGGIGKSTLAVEFAHRPDLAGHPTLAALAAELGDLPLALHLAGSYLETYRADAHFGAPDALLAELRSAGLLDHDALQGIDASPSPTNHDLHVARTFALSLDRLEPADATDAVARAAGSRRWPNSVSLVPVACATGATSRRGTCRRLWSRPAARLHLSYQPQGRSWEECSHSWEVDGRPMRYCGNSFLPATYCIAAFISAR